MSVLQLYAKLLPWENLADEAFELDRFLLSQIASRKKERPPRAAETFNIAELCRFPKGGSIFAVGPRMTDSMGSGEYP